MHRMRFGISGAGAAWKLEADLPSLASHAAIELDNLVIGRIGKMEAVTRLATLIEDSVPSREEPADRALLYDAATAVLMNDALVDSAMVVNQLAELDDLVSETRQVKQAMETITRDPESYRETNPEELGKVRAFCIALSRRASAYEQSVDDRPRSHPYRR